MSCKRNNDVQAEFLSVLSSMNTQLRAINTSLDALHEKLDAILGTNTELVENLSPLTATRRYPDSLESQIGGLVVDLPAPPAALTGKRRASNRTD